ncbi:hypothetical protein PHYPSEUDO_009405 [Phytophthora pseudosyringae]|uniref:Uncharacterized protein n=1 Tax=Phytophthora pseudosyringae TaxID=221518 RepID=A0A8T1W9E9_9STRA|nr:hypothetical protein PHYPSEUDO_009405 [Phytophthora pseudosyringae]
MVRLGLDKEREKRQTHPNLVDHSHLSEADLEAHPYHYVVLHSSGDLNEFKVLAGHIGVDDGDVDETMEIRVPSNSGGVGEPATAQSSPTSWTSIQATPATYASYLGYVDIVEWFVRSGPASKRFKWFAQKKEKSYVLINRARKLSKRVQASTMTA